MNLRVRRVQEVFDMVATLPSQGGAVPSCVPKRVSRRESSTLLFAAREQLSPNKIKIIMLRHLISGQKMCVILSRLIVLSQRWMRTLVGDRSSVGIREQTLATLERKLTEWVSGQRSAQTLCARVPVSVTQSRCPRLLLRASRLCRRFASTCARPARGARGCAISCSRATRT